MSNQDSRWLEQCPPDRPPCPIVPGAYRPRWVDYAFAVLIIAAVSLLVFLLDPFFPDAAFRIPYLLAIAAVGYFFGMGPAILATVLGLASYIYLEIPYRFTLWPIATTPSDWAVIASMSVGAFGLGIAMSLVRESKKRIERLARSLSESEAVLDAFFAESPVALVILDSDLRFIKVNPFASRILGRPSQEVEGRLLHDAMPEFAANIEARLRHILDSGQAETDVLVSGELPNKPGLHHWLFSHFPIVSGGGDVRRLGMIAIDVTRRVEAEAGLKRSEVRFRTTFDRAGIGMMIVDTTGILQTANPAFARLLGYSHDELPGMSVGKFGYWEDTPHTDALMLEMLRGERESFQTEKRYVRKDGSIIWCRLHASIARSPEPEPSFIIAMVEDVTGRVKAEEALKRELEYRKEFMRRTIMAATRDKLIITDRDEIESLDGRILASWDINSPRQLIDVRHEAIDSARAEGMSEQKVGKFATSVGEALTNAIKHAGAGQASLRRQDDRLLFVLSDQGPGIEELSLPAIALTPGYSTAGTLGMGYKLMISFSDRVYLATGPEGTTLGIEMDLSPGNATAERDDTGRTLAHLNIRSESNHEMNSTPRFHAEGNSIVQAR